MRLLFSMFALSCALYATVPGQDQIESYLEMVHAYSESIGHPGNASEGEIELLQDPELIVLAAEKTGRNVGILLQDRYWIWINDPVRLPNQTLGVYGRILNQGALRGCVGCAVIPHLENGRIALNCNFRHSTRSWEFEVPRGLAEPGELPEECAKREAIEETGLVPFKLVFLGDMVPNSGMSSAVISVFLAEISDCIIPTPEDSEAIASIVSFTIDELSAVLRDGFLLMDIQGKQQKVFLRDPFLTFGLLQMQVRGLLSKRLSLKEDLIESL